MEWKAKKYLCPLCPATNPQPWDYECPQTGIRVFKGEPTALKFLGGFEAAKAHFLAVHGEAEARSYGFLPPHPGGNRE